MLRKIISIIIVLAIIGTLVLTGCSKTTTLVLTPPVSQDTTTISFSADIQPIFTASCALSGCHVAGGKVPNLSTGVAYQSLPNGGYVVTNNTNNSQLMLWLTGKKTPGMPLGNSPDPVINAKVSAWISQGAKNN